MTKAALQHSLKDVVAFLQCRHSARHQPLSREQLQSLKPQVAAFANLLEQSEDKGTTVLEQNLAVFRYFATEPEIRINRVIHLLLMYASNLDLPEYEQMPLTRRAMQYARVLAKHIKKMLMDNNKDVFADKRQRIKDWIEHKGFHYSYSKVRPSGLGSVLEVEMSVPHYGPVLIDEAYQASPTFNHYGWQGQYNMSFKSEGEWNSLSGATLDEAWDLTKELMDQKRQKKEKGPV